MLCQPPTTVPVKGKQHSYNYIQKHVCCSMCGVEDKNFTIVFTVRSPSPSITQRVANNQAIMEERAITKASSQTIAMTLVPPSYQLQFVTNDVTCFPVG